jgi:hypothetical protein
VAGDALADCERSERRTHWRSEILGDVAVGHIAAQALSEPIIPATTRAISTLTAERQREDLSTSPTLLRALPGCVADGPGSHFAAWR